MNCPACSKEIPDGSVFCNLCGKSTLSQPKSNTKPWVMFLAGLAVAGLTAVYFVQNKPSETKRPEAPPHVAQAVRVPQPRSETIVDTAFTVNSGNWSAYKFEVPPNAKNVKVSGHFAATGGVNNDIEVFLTNEDGMANLKNRNPYKRFYFSGRVTQNSIDAPLPPSPDTYYLVFDNRFALMIPRAVQATATLNYLQ